MLVILCEKRFFCKVDFKGDYHQIRVYLGDQWYTTFQTNSYLYE